MPSLLSRPDDGVVAALAPAACGFSMTAKFSCHVSLSPSANFLVETRAERRAEKRSPCPPPVGAAVVGVVHAAGERGERGPKPPLLLPPLVSRRCWVWTGPGRIPEEELLFLKDFMALLWLVSTGSY